jgi:hypothetical protein
MPKDKTEPLDKSDTDNTNMFTIDNVSKLGNKKENKTVNKKEKSKQKAKRDSRNGGKITIKKYCDNYKHNYLGKQNKSLYNACKINQYCRKNKCKDIDRKLEKIKSNKLGANGNVLLMTSITNKCPIEMSNKSRKKCLNKATKRFYEENDMGEIYRQVLECDKKICAKERQIFLTNLFRANKTKKRIRQPVQVSIEDIPDQQMVESN